MSDEEQARDTTACPRCHAQPGDPCHNSAGDPMPTYDGGPLVHPARVVAWQEG